MFKIRQTRLGVWYIYCAPCDGSWARLTECRSCFKPLPENLIIKRNFLNQIEKNDVQRWKIDKGPGKP